MEKKIKISKPVKKKLGEPTPDNSKTTPLKTEKDKSYEPPQIELLGSLDELTQESATRSDIRLKSNIIRIGTHPVGVGWYEYDIEGRREQGVMAQELLLVKPEAVNLGSDGYYRVDYSKL